MKRLIPLLLFAGTAVLCLPFRPDHLASWDAIQLALGIERFDMTIHQPHPPGYLAPMAVAWVLHGAGLAADEAMQAQSILATALAAVSVFVLGRRIGATGEGLVAALLFAVHPVTLFYAVSGETYPAEALFAVLLVGSGLRLDRGARSAALAAFFLFYGLSGGVRQSLPLFFLPFAVWRLVVACRGRRGVFRPLAIAASASFSGLLVWLVPLVVLAGGPGRLMDQFGYQFFGLFGAHYSPLLGASGAAVRHNLDAFWRYVVEGLSASGVSSAILLAMGRFRPLRGEGFGIVLAAWVLPAFLWFGLMFIAKSGHLLFLVPAFTLASARVLWRAVGSRRWSLALTIAILLAQAGMFLAPPEWWIRTAGGRSQPAIQHDETLTTETIDALRRLDASDPGQTLVLTRDARFSFRQAMYYLPEMRVLWLMDSESTGARRSGGQVCEARWHRVRCSAGEGFWTSPVWPEDVEVPLDEGVRYVAWFMGPRGVFRREVERLVPVMRVRTGTLATIEITDLLAVPTSEFRIGPYRFVLHPGSGNRGGGG